MHKIGHHHVQCRVMVMQGHASAASASLISLFLPRLVVLRRLATEARSKSLKNCMREYIVIQMNAIQTCPGPDYRRNYYKMSSEVDVGVRVGGCGVEPMVRVVISMFPAA